MRGLLAGVVALLAAAWFVPALGMQARFAEGVDDVRTFYDGGSVWTNVGTRLELWKGAAMLIAEHPLFGMDFAGLPRAPGRVCAAGPARSDGT